MTFTRPQLQVPQALKLPDDFRRGVTVVDTWKSFWFAPVSVHPASCRVSELVSERAGAERPSAQTTLFGP